jgi:hypothetical protein
VICASSRLREFALDGALAEPIADRDSALRFHAGQGYLEARRQHHERLGHLGAYVLDLLPRQLRQPVPGRQAGWYPLSSRRAVTLTFQVSERQGEFSEYGRRSLC